MSAHVFADNPTAISRPRKFDQPSEAVVAHRVPTGKQ
jgi:hypothetical protein